MLEAGGFVDRDNTCPRRAANLLGSFNLITAKPLFYIANVDETDLEKTPLAPQVEAPAPDEAPAGHLPYAGSSKKSLPYYPDEERQGFMEMYGMKEKGHREDHQGRVWNPEDLIFTFYTVVGSQMRAWTVKKQTPVNKAAGKIHSDMERGFIKAEVIATADFLQAGSEHAAREIGLARIEGKEYVVEDGDILHIRFNVRISQPPDGVGPALFAPCTCISGRSSSTFATQPKQYGGSRTRPM